LSPKHASKGQEHIKGAERILGDPHFVAVERGEILVRESGYRSFE